MTSGDITRPFRVAGAVPGNSYDPHNNSGTAASLLAALSRRGLVARRLDVQISRGQRYRLAAIAFHPVRRKWQTRFRRAVYEAQSQNCVRLLKGDGEPNVVLQLFRGFQTGGLPYWLFLDTTDTIRRFAGRATPFGPDGLGYETEKALYQGASHIFVMATEPKVSLIRDYDVPGHRVTVVGAGVNIEYPERLGRLAELARYERRSVLFTSRRYFEVKGGLELLRAFECVRSEVPDARLTIAGVALPADPPGVQSLGEVLDREQMARLYREASVLCQPSRFEATGMSIMEGMAFGLPVVGTRVGGIPEAIRDEETGIIVEPGDTKELCQALVRLLSDPQEAARMGTHGRQVIDDERNWDAVVERMLCAVESPPSAGRLPAS